MLDCLSACAPAAASYRGWLRRRLADPAIVRSAPRQDAIDPGPAPTGSPRGCNPWRCARDRAAQRIDDSRPAATAPPCAQAVASGARTAVQ